MREDSKRAFDNCGVFYVGYKSQIKEAEKLLYDNENVLFATPTNFAYAPTDQSKPISCQGILYLTDKRIVIYYRPAFKSYSLIMPVEDVVNFEFITAGMANHIQAQTLNAVCDFTVTNNAVNAQLIYKIFLAVLEQYKPQNVPDDIPQNDTIDQIEKLAVLKDKGIITDEEFQSKKKELLSRI